MANFKWNWSGLKKNQVFSIKEKRQMIEPYYKELSVNRQCELLDINRSSYYYKPATESDLNLELMKLIDRQYIRTPYYGAPRMTAHLKRKEYKINHKRIARLMRKMGLSAIYPGSKSRKNHPGHKIYPYLLRDLKILKPNHVWSTDITYIPLRKGFLYLVAVLDWYSRYVLSWRLSNTLEVGFCIEALEEALEKTKPEIFNSDQGVQFTSNQFTNILAGNNIQISMDGRGRAFDNIFIERLWRSVKQEEVYIKDYVNGIEAYNGIKDYFNLYNNERLHQSLNYNTPAEIYNEIFSI